MTLSTHVLDAARGAPAAGVPVRWETRDDHGAWVLTGSGVTDGDGRIGAAAWLTAVAGPVPLIAGRHRLVFDVEAWADAAEPFFPAVTITFAVAVPRAGTHHHVPLLLSPYAYSTYRGS